MLEKAGVDLDERPHDPTRCCQRCRVRHGSGNEPDAGRVG